MILLIGVWIFFMRQMQGGGGGKRRNVVSEIVKARMMSEEQIKTMFADVAGCDEAKDVKELVDTFVIRRFQKLSGKIPTGILLVGPPGTGKTCLQKRLRVKRKYRSLLYLVRLCRNVRWCWCISCA